ncbi:uncharacterized protein LY79DRAFT_131569 [Colletotrichum navitas]|uniref:Uncharacterized protein n=1 Tax=Colletotrichum navitas TaxID=681940 RepID=A0AAD8V6Q0_9PEZI|nr:uncharacterized protein LY79DRAFT_131569 [Colletotrichum navitas]KAK1594528.1 hypothetical protein LY79DRAFT_131569 [Colletotrichum navitas]
MEGMRLDDGCVARKGVCMGLFAHTRVRSSSPSPSIARLHQQPGDFKGKYALPHTFPLHLRSKLSRQYSSTCLSPLFYLIRSTDSPFLLCHSLQSSAACYEPRRLRLPFPPLPSPINSTSSHHELAVYIFVSHLAYFLLALKFLAASPSLNAKFRPRQLPTIPSTSTDLPMPASQKTHSITSSRDVPVDVWDKGVLNLAA